MKSIEMQQIDFSDAWNIYYADVPDDQKVTGDRMISFQSTIQHVDNSLNFMTGEAT